MTSTVTSGELKIIEANVRGLGNKEAHVKEFLKRKKKKADIFCIVEHKTSKREKLTVLDFGSYKVVASDCRQTGGPGGGVALLVHDKLTGVKDAGNKFKEEFQNARAKGIEIAAIELKCKPKDCQNGLFVIGVYRRPTNKLPDFIKAVEELSNKVKINYKSTAIFTGDFNIDNSKVGQNNRSKKLNGELMRLYTLGYKLTHSMPSHSQGSTLNNFLVPINMRYATKTLKEGITISRQQRPVKDSDHYPIQIIVSLEGNTKSQQQNFILTRAALTHHQDRGNFASNTNAPGTSHQQSVQRSWIEEEDGVITILDDSDGEEPTSPEQPQSSHQDQTGVLFIRDGVSVIRVKLEGEPRRSRVEDMRSAEETLTISSHPPSLQSRPTSSQLEEGSRFVHNTSTIPSQRTTFQSQPTTCRVEDSRFSNNKSTIPTQHTNLHSHPSFSQVEDVRLSGNTSTITNQRSPFQSQPTTSHVDHSRFANNTSKIPSQQSFFQSHSTNSQREDSRLAVDTSKIPSHPQSFQSHNTSSRRAESRLTDTVSATPDHHESFQRLHTSLPVETARPANSSAIHDQVSSYRSIPIPNRGQGLHHNIPVVGLPNSQKPIVINYFSKRKDAHESVQENEFVNASNPSNPSYTSNPSNPTNPLLEFEPSRPLRTPGSQEHLNAPHSEYPPLVTRIIRYGEVQTIRPEPETFSQDQDVTGRSLLARQLEELERLEERRLESIEELIRIKKRRTEEAMKNT